MDDEVENIYPRSAILIQKMWRGYLTRKKFVKLLAVMRIIRVYRKYKFKKFFHAFFKNFGDIKKRADLGKNIPWPRSVPKALEKASDYMKQIFHRWRADQVQSIEKSHLF
jgi:hypothetical protein